jgi:hypothetical protein
MLLDALKIDPDLRAQALAAKPRLRAQSIHLILTVLAGAVVATALHQPILMVMFLSVGWPTSIFMFGIGPLPVWRIAAIVAVQALFLYLFYRFVLSPFFG